MPLAARLRAATRMLLSILDPFTRTVGSGLGSTPEGYVWQVISGAWSTNGTKAVTSTAATSNPIAAVDVGNPNVSVGSDVGANDAVYTRIGSSTSWVRAKLRQYAGSGTNYCTYTFYQTNATCSNCSNCASCGGNPASFSTISTTGCNTCPGSGCTGFVPFTCSVSSCNPTGTCTQACGTYSFNQFYVDVETMVGGTLTTVASVFLGDSVSVTQVRIATSDTTVSVYATVGGVETLVGTYTITAGQNNTKHGIGRGNTNTTTGDSSNLDNFTLVGA